MPSTKYEYKYSVEEYAEGTIPFSSCWSWDDLRHVAEDAAAQEYHSSIGESVFPLTFIIYAQGGERLGRYKVEPESTPRFLVEELD